MKSIAPWKRLSTLLAALPVAVALLCVPRFANAQTPVVKELTRLAAQSEKYGKHNDAETLYSRVLQHDPGNQFAHHRLGVLAAQRGDAKLAIKHFDNAQKNGPASVSLLADYGAALYLNGDLDAADSKLKAALALDPHNKQVKNNLKMVTLKRYMRFKMQQKALTEDEATRQAMAKAHAASRLRLIAEAKAASDLNAARQAISQSNAAEQLVRRQEQQRRLIESRQIAKQQVVRQPVAKRPAVRQPQTSRGVMRTGFNFPKLPDISMPKMNLPNLKLRKLAPPW